MLEAARQVWANARAPYSRFGVSAAVLAGSGRIYVGCNAETAAYTGTHAEQGAIAAAVAAGETVIVAVLVVGPNGKPCPPCGLCRQALREFGTNVRVVMEDGNCKLFTRTIGVLLPFSFGPETLEDAKDKE